MKPSKPAVHGQTSFRAPVAQSPRGRRLYDSRRWRTVSRDYLRRFPLCAACDGNGRVEAATLVDHIQPHRGLLALFWDEANWQPLCHVCHGLKTSIETRGVAAYANLTGKPAAHVTLVCGAPGSGRIDYINARLPGAVVVDEAGIAAGWAGVGRHEAPQPWPRAAMAERNRLLASMAREPVDRLAVVIDGATHGERREWKKRIGADEVVVLECDLEDCIKRAGEVVRPLASAWWKRYSVGHDEVTVRV